MVPMVTDYDCWHEEHALDRDRHPRELEQERLARGESGGGAAVGPLPANAMQMWHGARARASHDPKVQSPKTLEESWTCWLESISTPDNAAQELLDHCLARRPWPEHLLDPLLAEPGNCALFSIVVERFGRFV